MWNPFPFSCPPPLRADLAVTILASAVIRRVVTLLPFILVSLSALCATGELRAPAHSASGGLQIELTTNKQVYEVGEPILVTITLRNIGEKAFYVTSTPRIIHSSTGGIVEVEIVGPDDRTLEGTKSIGEFLGLGGEPLESWIRRHRRLFQPGDFVGFERSLERLGYEIDKPGRYRLLAKYWETNYEGWSERLVGPDKELEEVKRKLLFPLWSGEIVSEWVDVDVRR